MATIQRRVIDWVNTLPIGEVFTVERCAQGLDLTSGQAASALANQLRNYAGLPYERVTGHGVYRRITPSEPFKYKLAPDDEAKVPLAISGADQHPNHTMPTPDVKYVGRSAAGEVLVLVDGIVGKVVPV